jgi:hypothetical protein
MSNTQAFANSARVDLLTGQHNFGVGFVRAATTQDVFKGALYFATATINASTTAYSATGEVGNSGSYVAGGLTFGAFNAPANTGAQAYTTPTASWSTGAGFSATAFDCILMYNSSNSNKAVAAFTFGSQTIVAGTFTLTMPTNGAGTGLVQVN